jgi:hypothetical protein
MVATGDSSARAHRYEENTSMDDDNAREAGVRQLVQTYGEDLGLPERLATAGPATRPQAEMTAARRDHLADRSLRDATSGSNS